MRVHHIVPPYLLEHLERTADDPNLRARYRQSLQHDAVFRARPSATQRQDAAPFQDEGPTQGPRRVVHDAEHGTSLPGTVVRAEGDPATTDLTVNQAYDGTGATWAMFQECFGRDSIDGAGLLLSSTVHFDRGYANAFWDGTQMVFGDGDGEIFGDFTRSIDVTGHELTHGVTQYTADLAYEGQSGALNESISDVFGSLAKQHHRGQSAADADWLIGADIFRPGVSGVALRSLKAPGTAYDDPRLGRDPQPAHMSGYVETTADHGGVHINSGIPNHAFYLVAMALGGNAYGDAGRIWYDTLTSGELSETATFIDFAQATLAAAETLFGADSPQVSAVSTAWTEVGVLQSDSSEPSQPSEPSEPERSQPSGSAESVELMRAAKTALSTGTPPRPPPFMPPTPDQPAEPAEPDPATADPDTPANHSHPETSASGSD
ncbi:thermolysin metallopeptidase-like protein [Kribbella orskensis]|uniref:Neutral metalloproteinase n=1 Tax=Kribbella orskensis TaxID=2512216 RepID=A0ABY2BQR4_9ACTN|nr:MULTISPECIES: M4 family metallopeptidase [Kribbella]TCN37267.1 thermolysin metallopeptidase-like protein [Kribbella sp. VKM Ac-2500]TCO27825.1 thermolysin metallopeptidase-like protein [Kribbella orskensis]